MHKIILTLTAVMLIFSAIGFLFFPASMLAVVGIPSNAQTNFLLQSAGVGVAPLVPGVWMLRAAPVSPLSRSVIIGLVIFLFLSSIVDFIAYTQSIVNAISIPSIGLRILLGMVILILVRKER